jgi:hypothetical protein
MMAQKRSAGLQPALVQESRTDDATVRTRAEAPRYEVVAEQGVGNVVPVFSRHWIG